MSLCIEVFVEVLVESWVFAGLVEDAFASEAVVDVLIVLDLGVAFGTDVAIGIASLNHVLLAVYHFRVLDLVFA